jgi:bacterioferritin
MKGDPKIIEHLNKALRLELTAINQYWLHFRLVEEWGYVRLAKREREASIEEMRHADRLADRILFLEGLPNMQELNRLRIGQSVTEVLEADLAGEREMRAAYLEARRVCDSAADFGSIALFEDLLKAEEAHIDFLETELQLLTEVGVERYAELPAEAADNTVDLEAAGKD